MATTEWKETTLGEVAVVDWGNTNLTKRVYDPMGEYLAVSAAGCDGRITHAEHPVGTTVISAIGEYAGRVFYPREPFTAIKNTLTVKAKNGLADDNYLHYLLVKNNIPRRGAAQPFLSKGDTMAYQIELPSLSEQRSIAVVLSSLDDKIELLGRQNETLEQIAQAIFNEWFVKPTADGALPDGWRMGTLGDVLSLEYGKALKEEDRTTGEYPVIGSSGVVGQHNEYLVQGEGVVVGRKGTMGSVLWVDNSFYPIDTTFFIKDKLGVGKLHYHYCLLKTFDFEKVGSDSAVPGLNRNAAYSLSVSFPSNDITDRFNTAVTPMFAKQRLNREQIASLGETRDVLLSRLMDGEIRVWPEKKK